MNSFINHLPRTHLCCMAALPYLSANSFLKGTTHSISQWIFLWKLAYTTESSEVSFLFNDFSNFTKGSMFNLFKRKVWNWTTSQHYLLPLPIRLHFLLFVVRTRIWTCKKDLFSFASNPLGIAFSQFRHLTILFLIF